MSGLLLLTRDDPRDDSMALDAERDGQEVARVALLGTEPGGDADRFAAWLETPQVDAAIAWTSRRAAEALLALLTPARRAGLSHAPLFAVGAESAAPVANEGYRVDYVPEQPDASRLAEKIVEESERRAFRRVAFLHGDRALPDLPRALREAGITVEPYELYRIRFLPADVSPVTRALDQGRQILAVFFSPSGVEALEKLLPGGAVDRFRAEAWTMPYGATTARALRDRGYARVPAPVERVAAGAAGGEPAAARRSTGSHG
ncbi:MAG TPA: uroporphyrinogen-III synthase [Candidatus Eisenbacteria bacterium]|nr:uroporphyrinogen-III synthase [Candidatus Eisenbacteria bacterium]